MCHALRRRQDISSSKPAPSIISVLSRNYIATLQFGSLHNIVLEGQILNVVQYHYNSSPDYGYDEYYTMGMDVYGPQTRFVFGAGGLLDDNYYEFRASTIYVGFTGHRTGEDVPDAETYYRFTLAEVPEPAAWGMLIGGFGLAGATLRRRRHPSHEQPLERTERERS